ncbi:MAG: hypothetical protein IT437_02875 [Phycisphaerales bacterium]|nr:hypothetical protein [Phycisphaerales bacterium]
MGLLRTASLSIVTIVATGWAGAVALLGLWVVFEFAPGNRFETPLTWAGISILAVAQFVLMVAVADRVYPAVGSRIAVWCLEMSIFLIVLAAMAVAAATWLWGAVP